MSQWVIFLSAIAYTLDDSSSRACFLLNWDVNCEVVPQQFSALSYTLELSPYGWSFWLVCKDVAMSDFPLCHSLYSVWQFQPGVFSFWTGVWTVKLYPSNLVHGVIHWSYPPWVGRWSDEAWVLSTAPLLVGASHDVILYLAQWTHQFFLINVLFM